MVGDSLGVLQHSAVLEIGCDAGRSERVAADGRWQANLPSTSLDHRENFQAMNAASAELAMSVEGSKEGSVTVAFDQSGVEVRIDVFLGLVVSRNVVELAAFFVESEPHSSALREVVFDIHRDDRSDTSEAVDHHGDQCSIAKSGDRGDVDALQKFAGLVRRKNRRLAFLDRIPRPTNRACRIRLEDLADNQSIAKNTNCCKVLLHRWYRSDTHPLFDVERDVQRGDVGE